MKSELVEGKDWLDEGEFEAIVRDRLTSINDTEPVVETDTSDVVAGDTTTTDDTAPAVKEDASGRLRNPDGTFAPKPEEGDEDEPETEEAEETDEIEPSDEEDTPIEIEIDDPEVMELLEKYDGDIVKALKAAREAQSHIGRQGSDLGELRKQNEALMQRLDQMQELITRGPAPSPREFAELVVTNPAEAAMLAKQHGDYEGLVAAVTAWKDGTEDFDADPFGAAVFWNGLQNEFAAAQAAEAARPAAETQQAAEGADPAEVVAVLQRNPDLEKYLPAIGEEAKNRPLLRRALEEGTAAEKAEALESLYLLAKSRLGVDTSREAVEQQAARASEDARKARSKATVVSARRRSSASDDQPTGADQFRTAFRQRMGLPLEDE